MNNLNGFSAQAHLFAECVRKVETHESQCSEKGVRYVWCAERRDDIKLNSLQRDATHH